MSHTSTPLSYVSPENLEAFASYPAIPPPPGVIPNFVDPENQNLPLFAVASLLLGIMTLFMLNRVYVKTFIVKKYSLDDGNWLPYIRNH
jgi:hypothetical protein